MKPFEAKRTAVAFAAVVLLWAGKQLVRFPQQWVLQTFADAELQTALLLLLKLLLFGSVWVWLWQMGGVPPWRGWWKKEATNSWLLFLVPMLLTGNAVGLLAMQLLGKAAPPAQPPQSPFHAVLEVALSALLPAVAEEGIFRKEIQRRFLGLGKANALFCTAVLFALMHNTPLQMLSSFAGSIFLGLAALRWGTGASVRLHLANNLLALLSSWFGAAGGWTGMALAITASLVWAVQEYHKKEKRH